jgi:hypothetical protein
MICLLFLCPFNMLWAKKFLSSSRGDGSPALMSTPQALSMGQAVRGIARTNSALIYNPAGMSIGSNYAVDLQYFRSSQKENVFGLNVVDSQTRHDKDQLALGIAYQQFLNDGVQGYEARLGFSLPMSKGRGFKPLIGLSGRYTCDELTKQEGFDLDAGLMFVIGEIFNIGVVGEGLLNEQDFTRLGIGGGLTHRQFNLGVDWVYNPILEYDLMSGGAELLLGQFVVRGGYEQLGFSYNKPKYVENQWFSGGLAIVDVTNAQGRLNLGYRRSIQTGEYLFGVSFSMFVTMPSMGEF